MRLSSDFLYHYKADITVLELVLKHGFRHNMWPEKYPYRSSEQLNYVVCFCDILPSQAGYHRSCYGDNAIALTKEWGIRNGVSPVRYVHEKSPGTDEAYLEFKNRLRFIMKKCNGNISDITIDLISSCLAESTALTMNTPVAELLAQGNLNFIHEVENHERRIIAATGHGDDRADLLKKVALSFFQKVNMLIQELEKRDSFMRIYSDDFVHPISGQHPDKVLYDEREWRSVKFLTSNDETADPGIIQLSFSNRYLPERFNLTFSKDDVEEIRVANLNDANAIAAIAADPNSLITGLDQNRIKTW